MLPSLAGVKFWTCIKSPSAPCRGGVMSRCVTGDVLQEGLRSPGWGSPSAHGHLLQSRSGAAPSSWNILVQKYLLSHTSQTVTAFNKHYGRAIQWAGFPMVPELLLISISA